MASIWLLLALAAEQVHHCKSNSSYRTNWPLLWHQELLFLLLIALWLSIYSQPRRWTTTSSNRPCSQITHLNKISRSFLISFKTIRAMQVAAKLSMLICEVTSSTNHRHRQVAFWRTKKMVEINLTSITSWLVCRPWSSCHLVAVAAIRFLKKVIICMGKCKISNNMNAMTLKWSLMTMRFSIIMSRLQDKCRQIQTIQRRQTTHC